MRSGLRARLLTSRKRTIILTLCYEGLLVGFWFVDHAYVALSVPPVYSLNASKRRQALRWYCLFLGVMK